MNVLIFVIVILVIAVSFYCIKGSKSHVSNSPPANDVHYQKFQDFEFPQNSKLIRIAQEEEKRNQMSSIWFSPWEIDDDCIETIESRKIGTPEERFHRDFFSNEFKAIEQMGLAEITINTEAHDLDFIFKYLKKADIEKILNGRSIEYKKNSTKKELFDLLKSRVDLDLYFTRPITKKITFKKEEYHERLLHELGPYTDYLKTEIESATHDKDDRIYIFEDAMNHGILSDIYFEFFEKKLKAG